MLWYNSLKWKKVIIRTTPNITRGSLTPGGWIHFTWTLIKARSWHSPDSNWTHLGSTTTMRCPWAWTRGSPATFPAWVKGRMDTTAANKSSLANNCLKYKPWVQPLAAVFRMVGLPFWTKIRKWMCKIEDLSCFKVLQLLDIFSVPKIIKVMARTLQSDCPLVSDCSPGLLFRWIEFFRFLERTAAPFRSRWSGRPFFNGRSAPPSAN